MYNMIPILVKKIQKKSLRVCGGGAEDKMHWTCSEILLLRQLQYGEHSLMRDI